MILRGDGAILEPVTLSAPHGTPARRRVHALTDGTRVESPPQASRHTSWSLESIQSFASARVAGVDPCLRASAEVLDDVHGFLEARVRLPDPDDLWIVATFVVVTHLFRVFDALPLLLVSGPRGSGKSELASAVVAVGFNAVMMGQGSAAALVRLTRQCGGLVALDDAEGLATQASGFGELGQCLKLGYKSGTARKPVAMGNGQVDTYDFFGPRLLTCTRGVDPVLGSRCIGVVTAPAELGAVMEAPDPDALRDELHCLAMARASEVAEAHSGLAAAASDRLGEIWSPMLAVARTLGSRRMVEAVERRWRRRGPAGHGCSVTGTPSSFASRASSCRDAPRPAMWGFRPLISFRPLLAIRIGR